MSDSDPIPEIHHEGLPIHSPDFAEADGIDNIIPSRGYNMTPMVAIGGSAGCIPALQKFFNIVPPDSGLIFVVILHLSPDHASTLPELLSRSTQMPVTPALDRERAEANHVYVIQPGKHLLTTDGHFLCEDMEGTVGRRVAIDLFFRSLADTHGPHAAAIILSGADADGTLGIKRIKERGGLTIAQDPGESEHPSMPRSAIETGMVDWILEVAQMPQRLLDYIHQEKNLTLPAEEGHDSDHDIKLSPSQAEASLRDVLTYLRTRTGRDFS